MSALFFIFISTIWGWHIVIRVRPSRDGLTLLCGAYLIGLLASTWLAFIASLLSGVLYPIYLPVISCLMIVHIFLMRRAETDTPFDIIWRIEWPLALMVIFIVVPYFLYGCMYDSEGNLCVFGNYCDLSYHWGIICHFVEQRHFNLENPQSAGHILNYHFLINFHTALLIKGGLSYLQAFVLDQFPCGLCLFILLWNFMRLVLKRFGASLIAVLILMFSHQGFSNIMVALAGGKVVEKMAPAASLPFGDQLLAWCDIFHEYYFNFLHPLVNYFHPQRPFLVGFPLFLLAMMMARAGFLMGKKGSTHITMCGLILGLMPLFHMHSFLTAVIILSLTSYITRKRHGISLLRFWPVALAVPQMLFLSLIPKPHDYSGWDVWKSPVFHEMVNTGNNTIDHAVFWIRVGGLCAIFGLPAIYLWLRKYGKRISYGGVINDALVLVAECTGIFYFLLINVYRITPLWQDSNKLYFYYCAFASIAIGAWWGSLWRRGRAWRLLIGLVMSIVVVIPFGIYYFFDATQPMLSLIPAMISGRNINTPWITDKMAGKWANKFNKYNINLSTGEIVVGKWIKDNLPPYAVIATYDDVTQFIPAISGRCLLDGSYTQQTGLLFEPKLKDRIYNAYKNGDFETFAELGATDVLIGPNEKARFEVDGSNWRIHPVFQVKYKEETFRIFSLEEGIWKYPDPGKVVWLSTIKPLSVEQQFGKPCYDRSLSGGKLVMGDRTFSRGIATHARSRIDYDLGKQYALFRAVVGIHDSEKGSCSSVIFRVLCDGKMCWQSKVMTADGKTESVEVPVGGITTLTLEVDDAGNGNRHDHAVWGAAHLIPP